MQNYVADDILMSVFGENKVWYFMWITCLANDSHEMLSLIISKK